MTLAAASVLAGRLRLSAIPVFIVAGILLGPSPGFPTVIEPSRGHRPPRAARDRAAAVLPGARVLARPDHWPRGGSCWWAGVIDLVAQRRARASRWASPCSGPAPRRCSWPGWSTCRAAASSPGRSSTCGGWATTRPTWCWASSCSRTWRSPSSWASPRRWPAGDSVGGGEIAATAGLALRFVFAFLLVGRWAHHAIDRIAPRLDREQLLLAALARRARRRPRWARRPGSPRRSGRCSPGSCCRAARCATRSSSSSWACATSRRRSSSSPSAWRWTWAQASRDVLVWLVRRRSRRDRRQAGGRLPGRAGHRLHPPPEHQRGRGAGRAGGVHDHPGPARRGRRGPRRRLPRPGGALRGPVRPGDGGRRSGIDEGVAAHRTGGVPARAPAPTRTRR